MNHEVLEHRVTVLEEAVSEIAKSVQSIDKSIALLATQKEWQDITREKLMHQDDRIRELELKMPVLEVIKGWVIAGVVGGLGMMLAAVGRLVLKA